MPSTNSALAVCGYVTAPSPSYGLKRVLRDGEPVGHFDCQTAWSLPGMAEYAARLAEPNAQRQMAEAQRLLDAWHADKGRRPVPDVDPAALLAEIGRLIDAA